MLPSEEIASSKKEPFVFTVKIGVFPSHTLKTYKSGVELFRAPQDEAARMFAGSLNATDVTASPQFSYFHETVPPSEVL